MAMAAWPHQIQIQIQILLFLLLGLDTFLLMLLPRLLSKTLWPRPSNPKNLPLSILGLSILQQGCNWTISALFLFILTFLWWLSLSICCSVSGLLWYSIQSGWGKSHQQEGDQVVRLQEGAYPHRWWSTNGRLFRFLLFFPFLYLVLCKIKSSFLVIKLAVYFWQT